MPFDPPLTHRVERTGSDDLAFSFKSLPDRPGVVVFESERGETVFIGVAASVREAARRRLGAPDEGEKTSRRVDLRPITARVLAATVGSAFEADAAYLHHVRLRRPREHRAAGERWQGWFVHIDPAARFPKWTKVCFPGWADGRGEAPEARRGAFIGPFRDKHVAGRYIELMDDLFDLCRYHHILMQAPRATACAYKEMGKCPAPCDGSETMESYRMRVADAGRFADAPLASAIAEVEARMRGDAAAQRFEEAERGRRLAERMRAAEKPAFRLARGIGEFRWLIVGRSERAGRARLTLAVPGELHSVADVRAADAEAAIASVATTIERLVGTAQEFSFGDVEQETLGLVCARLFDAGPRSKAEALIRLGAPGGEVVPVAEVQAAVTRVCSPRNAKAGLVEDRTFEDLTPADGPSEESGAPKANAGAEAASKPMSA